MAVTDVERRVRADAIEIAPPLDVPKPDAFAARDHDVERRVVPSTVAGFSPEINSLARSERRYTPRAVKEFSLATCFRRLERLIARDHPGVAAKGRTIAFLHAERRERSVVLLHGMSASPSPVRAPRSGSL